jgi:hypothetical protein
VRFLITGKSEKGFTILLNKPAPMDIPFSWTAFAVKNPKIWNSTSTVPILPVETPIVTSEVNISPPSLPLSPETGTSTPEVIVPSETTEPLSTTTPDNIPSASTPVPLEEIVPTPTETIPLETVSTPAVLNEPFDPAIINI